jgi:pyruvate/2-oxoglutarate/acetoin dehydrogenase E1 component
MNEYSGREALNRALDHALAADERVLLLGEDLADPVGGPYGVTRGLSTKHGRHRVGNLSSAATATTGAAVGAALEGMVAVAELPVDALTGPALDQLAQAAVLHDPSSRHDTDGSLVFRVRLPGDAAGRAALGHSFARVPGLKVVVPGTPADAEALLTAAVRDPAPCVVLEPVSLYETRGPLAEDARTGPGLGAAAISRRGTDVTVVTYGAARAAALHAADDLATEDILIDVVDLRYLVPCDVETVLTMVRRTRRLVLAPDAAAPWGPCAEIAELVNREFFGNLRAPVEHAPGHLGGPAPADIAAAVRTAYGHSASPLAFGKKAS